MPQQQLFNPQPEPKSKLGHYRRLGSNAGVHVSPIVLGALGVGDNSWEKYGSGPMGIEQSIKLLDAYFDLGGNFIDTAGFYVDETSEKTIGEWAESKGIRDQLFIATKYAINPKHNNPSIAQKVLYGGTNAKAMHLCVENSLKNLRTSYIDLLYIHFWDYETSIPELMQALHALVLARKVIYLGASDTPAWVVAKANQYARDHALTPFAVYQGNWNVLNRSFERDIIPMARDEGMALAPWGVLAAGKIRTDAEEERRRETGENGNTVFTTQWERSDTERRACRVLEEVALEVGAKNMTSVAIAYVMHKARFVFPIIGGRKVEHLVSNLEALDLTLTEEHLARIEKAVPFEPGFPHTMTGNGTENVILHILGGHIERWPEARPITGSK